MKTTTLFRLLLELSLLLSAAPGWAGTTPRAPRPASARLDAHATQLTDYLTQALGLTPAQVPPVRAAVERREQATAALRRQRFPTAADRSAAYTVVEYKFYNALTAALTASQFDAFLRLDDQLLAVR